LDNLLDLSRGGALRRESHRLAHIVHESSFVLLIASLRTSLDFQNFVSDDEQSLLVIWKCQVNVKLETARSNQRSEKLQQKKESK